MRVGLQAAGADSVPVYSIVHAFGLFVLFALTGVVRRTGATPAASLESRARCSSLCFGRLRPLLSLGKGLCFSTGSAKAHTGRICSAIIASLAVASGLSVAVVVVGSAVVGGDTGAAAFVLRSDLGQEALTTVDEVKVDRHRAQIRGGQFAGGKIFFPLNP